ncbi:MAG: ABC transporter ATP-binding protein [endosymbiont of Galathealinum brachiosum]|uniref:ABC transporter ATP-binding protein n=1 Tax=endosymbiont of Galathealinum brachiosum TaxID=2200906 RepID=A0A370DCW8_9GAMM|nr:MAG: ABC transporter ATP-binding protein [endosymbiont of Galathealinum brachiosum]
MQPILQVNQLYKQFNRLKAVNGISFDVPEGICLGLLGPNGAGKTTTVEMLEGIKSPDKGSILYRGKSLDSEFKNRAGIMFQSTALQDFITVRESLELFQQLYPKVSNLEQIITDCALNGFLDQDTASLSGGQRQRVLLAIAMVNDPEIIFLDEPTTGLDPQARHNFWRLIEKIKQQNKTVVLTTHYMEEAYELCDKIIIMDHGEIIAEGTPDDLLSEHFNDVVIQMPYSTALEMLLERLNSRGVLSFSCEQKQIEICTSDVNQAIELLLAADISLNGLQIRERTLEDLFLELTGKGLRQ